MEISITRSATTLSFSLRNLRDLVAQVEEALAANPDATLLSHLERQGPYGLFYVDVQSDVQHYGERIPGAGGYDSRPSVSPAEEDRLRQEHEVQHSKIRMVAEDDFPCCSAGHSVDGTALVELSPTLEEIASIGALPGRR